MPQDNLIPVALSHRRRIPGKSLQKTSKNQDGKIVHNTLGSNATASFYKGKELFIVMLSSCQTSAHSRLQMAINQAGMDTYFRFLPDYVFSISAGII
jgi:hypothetical protein